MTGLQPNEALLEVLTGPLEASGVDLEGVEISNAGRRRLVRVLVDKDTGITLDDVADATHLVSGVLDSSDVLGESPYTLEVTSPGIDRPIRTLDDIRRNTGRRVFVTAAAEQDVERSYRGRLLGHEDGCLVLSDDEQGETRLPLEGIVEARQELES